MDAISDPRTIVTIVVLVALIAGAGAGYISALRKRAMLVAAISRTTDERDRSLAETVAANDATATARKEADDVRLELAEVRATLQTRLIESERGRDDLVSRVEGLENGKAAFHERVVSLERDLALAIQQRNDAVDARATAENKHDKARKELEERRAAETELREQLAHATANLDATRRVLEDDQVRMERASTMFAELAEKAIGNKRGAF